MRKQRRSGYRYALLGGVVVLLLPALAAAAAATTTLKIGTGITLVAQRDPIWLAKQTASLDTISGGRFLLGVGYGWNKEELHHHGVAYGERRAVLRERILTHPLLCKYFRMLTVGDLVPEEFRQSGIQSYYDKDHGWTDIWEAWANDEFTLDATRLTLGVGMSGLDGDTFKNDVLMDKYGIQINKTSRNTVLFMTNIGTSRSSVAFLIEVLVKIATALEQEQEDASRVERKLIDKRVRSLSKDLPPLPDFSHFHAAFAPGAGLKVPTPDGDIRKAFFYAYDAENCEYSWWAISWQVPMLHHRDADACKLQCAAATRNRSSESGAPLVKCTVVVA